MKKVIDNINVYVSDPYPCWIDIGQYDKNIRIPQDQLDDLIYLLQWAKTIVKEKNKPR